MNLLSTSIKTADVLSKHMVMSSMRKVSLLAGLFYLLTFVSIPTLVLYHAIHQPGWVTGNGSGNPVIIGVILEMIVALAGIGTAVILYPVLKRHNGAMALGFVSSRILEAATMFLGVTFLLSIVTLRQQGVGADVPIISHTLIILYDRIFLVGQSFFPAVNAVLLGTLLYQLRLVPRLLPLVGMIGAALLITSDIAVLFGFIGQHDPSTSLAAVPIALWEFSLGIWLIFKGFKTDNIELAVTSLKTI